MLVVLVLLLLVFDFSYELIYRGQAEKEFRVEVEAIGHVRHKNLVRLLGYCVEGVHRYDPFLSINLTLLFAFDSVLTLDIEL